MGRMTLSGQKKKVYPVLLAGGTGTRLWPVSSDLHPKQLVRFMGKNTLIQDTIKRLEPVIDTEKIRIVCQEAHFHEIAKQIKELGIEPEGQIICEPCGRNTAPAVLLAALKIQQEETEAILCIFPADHVIENINAFHRRIESAIELAARGYIVSFGIQPDYPETGYGYIEGDKEISGGALSIKKFIEKPDRETAKKYIESGNFFWNSGIFAFRASVIAEEFKHHQAQLLMTMERLVGSKDILDKNAYERLPNISIDYAIMEKTKKGVVLPSDFQWSDIGSWKSLYNFLPKDKNKNVIVGDVIANDTENSFILSHDRLVVTHQMKNTVVVETPNSVFVSDLDNSRDVKSIVQKLKKTGRKEYRKHQTTFRCWGHQTTVEQNEDFKISRIIINPGPVRQIEVDPGIIKHFFVLSGRIKIKDGAQTRVFKKGDSIAISGSSSHHIGTVGDEPLCMIQVEVDVREKPS